jgi:hypothetical protein
MRFVPICFCCFLVLQSLFADETNLILTVDGVAYSNVTFGAVTPNAVSILHSTGVSSIPLAKLPPNLQKQFGYNPAKAEQSQPADAKAGRAEQEKAPQPEQQKTGAAKELTKNAEFRAGGRVVAVLPEGIILEYTASGSTRPSPNLFDRVHALTAPPQTHRTLLVGDPKQAGLSPGASVDGYMSPSGTFTYDGETLPRYVWIAETAPKTKQ